MTMDFNVPINTVVNDVDEEPHCALLQLKPTEPSHNWEFNLCVVTRLSVNASSFRCQCPHRGTAILLLTSRHITVSIICLHENYYYSLLTVNSFLKNKFFFGIFPFGTGSGRSVICGVAGGPHGYLQQSADCDGHTDHSFGQMVPSALSLGLVSNPIRFCITASLVSLFAITRTRCKLIYF